MLMKICLSDAARVCLGVVLGLSVGAAQGALIKWNYQALLTNVTGGPDPLGVDGEILSLEISYEDTNTWSGSGNFLFFGSESATVGITGSNTIALDSPTPSAPKPAALYITSPTAADPASVTAADQNSNILDFIINGVSTDTLGFQGQSSLALAPSLGETLLAGQLLIPETLANAGISGCVTGGGRCYSLTTISSVPVPPALWLFGSGVLGLIGGLARRRGC
jgi:hypothetical protein